MFANRKTGEQAKEKQAKDLLLEEVGLETLVAWRRDSEAQESHKKIQRSDSFVAEIEEADMGDIS